VVRLINVGGIVVVGKNRVAGVAPGVGVVLGVVVVSQPCK
jgi:hypothetical protein